MYEGEKVGAVIAAGGSSRRMGGADKLFALLNGKHVLGRVLEVFQSCPVVDRIVLVLSRENLVRGEDLRKQADLSKLTDIIPGGERRQDSVIAGLGLLPECGWIVIHDGARPLVTPEIIERSLEEAQETGAAVAAVPVTDTIKVAGDDLLVQGTPPRGNLWSVQTPQTFRGEIIRQAYDALKYEVTDDARAVEIAGGKVKLFTASYDNMKITTAGDIALAEILLKNDGK